VQTLATTLDGKAVTIEHGRLNLSGVMPGKHRLEAVATDGAGLSTTAALDFTYEPGQFALQEILRGLVPKNDNGRAVQKELLNAAQELSNGNVRAKLDEISVKLNRGAGLFKPFPTRALNAAIEFQKEHAAQTVEVRLLDAPPYFSTDKVVVRPGDTVRWKYDPPSDGHYMSAKLHRIEIGGVNVRSELLRAGESFAYRFEQAGEFVIKDTEKGAGAITVRVVDK
jgi:plastocyanin